MAQGDVQAQGEVRARDDDAAPAWLGEVDGGGAAAAILVAAARLFSERSPSKVTLREIAELAGVNYGLIHHYYGTKDAILAELIRHGSEAGAVSMQGTTTVADALDALVDPNSAGAHIRMLAWVLLSDTEAARSFSASPAVRHLEAIADAGAHATAADPVDAKVFAVALVSALMGWQMFRPFLVAAAELDDEDPSATNAAVYAMLQRMANAALRPT